MGIILHSVSRIREKRSIRGRYFLNLYVYETTTRSEKCEKDLPNQSISFFLSSSCDVLEKVVRRDVERINRNKIKTAFKSRYKTLGSALLCILLGLRSESLVDGPPTLET